LRQRGTSLYSAPRNGDVMRLYNSSKIRGGAYLIHAGKDASSSTGCIIPFKAGLGGKANLIYGKGIVNQIRQGNYKSLSIIDGF